MTQATAHDRPAVQLAGDDGGAALVIGFTYSDDIVEFALDLRPDVRRRRAVACLRSGQPAGGRNPGVEVADHRPGQPPGTFLRRQLTGLWGLGAALVLVSHLVLIATAAPRARLGCRLLVWVSLLSTLVFVTAMALMLISALSEGSTTASRAGWFRSCWELLPRSSPGTVVPGDRRRRRLLRRGLLVLLRHGPHHPVILLTLGLS